jgi:phosphatidylinositol 4-kinase
MTLQRWYVSRLGILALPHYGIQEDPMKPTLDRMIDQIVSDMTDEAREFYDRQFGFFHEVTSISGKLKPYIKKSKPEKKVRILGQ